MQRYAASITGQTAQTLDPELIIVDGNIETEKSKREGKAKQNAAPIDTKTGSHGSSMPQKGKGKNSSNSGRKKADIIRENNMKAKSQKSDDKISSVWMRLLGELVDLTDNAADFQEACLTVLARLIEFQKVKLKSDSTSYIYLETRVYRLSVLLDLWKRACGKSRKEKENHQNLAALILDECRNILDSPALTRKVVNIVTKVWVDMGFGDLSKTHQPQAKDNLSSQIKSCHVNPEMRITQSPVEFQLMFSGPYMDRSFGSAPDPRVKFQPDTWQREVLDEIDANKSVFVVAPTSAGKTFICFYAMEKVLRGSNNGILVYVAPTKALVNQIAAEVLARFTKNYPHAGQTVWAIHTRDYRINNPEQCQILITVPHILQIMLLSPHNAEKWAPRVKGIIFDEVHSIGQADDGVIWEQLLLIAPCPIIALSATVGNPDEFRDWLVETQKAADIDLKMIQHQYRYSDLRKFTYHTSAEEVFTGLGERKHFQELDEPNFVAINPISTLLDAKHRNIPDDLSLEPRDCLELYASMMKHQAEDWTVNPDLNPSQCFDGVIGKVDVIKWEAALKRELGKWMAHPDSPYDRVMEDLTRTRNVRHPHKGNRDPSPSPTRSEISSIETIEDDAHDNDETTRETTLSLLARLHAKNALPAILFSFDRTMVEKTATTILKQLEEAEAEFKKTDKEYLDKVKRYHEWVKQKKQKPKSSDKIGDKSQNKTKSRKNKDDEIDALKNERNQEEREDPSKWTSFDPDAPHEKFLFAGKVNHDIEEDFAILEKANVPEVFISVLRRGIGIHHAGLSRRLREATETLFRMGYLKIVIATGTLALGINMPCKTVGFLGDSVYLTALSYRQCSGRAGRRGFDLFGNVIFHGLSRAKVNRLICSRLPSLKGHFPISTSLVLRMFSLLGGSNESQYSRKAVSQLLSQSRLFLGGNSFKEQVLHHLRFSVEYLRRQQLIDGRGSAINFAGLVGHLYYTENSAFAFHALLKEGVFHTICKDVERKPQRTCMVLMMVLAHIFGRRGCKDPKYMSQKMLETIKRSPSEVFLEALPGIAQRALKKHNEETVATFTTYATTFATQHCKNLNDNVLPFSGVNVGGTAAWTRSQVHARSTFYRLSGRDDRFNSIKDLATSARRGVFLESSTVPIVDFESGCVNAYLLDFYKHGSIRPLVNANGLRRNDVWFLLNDFSMILATIVTSVKNFLSEREGGLSEDDLFTVSLGDVEETGAGQEGLVFEREDADGDLDISSASHAAVNDPAGLLEVLKAFFLLKRQFDVKLAAIGATKKPERRGKEKKPRLRVDV
ncbi:hypothetical protein H072_1643 [Dactylellina haptotyla CBS 200.50]|uniref:Helicase ATP-binding domain-containing protein n=1 Tax=Dactylellina haptotyla (strain CBS 200.50) TaxID=1284197 RepID=S8ATT9_DACHA|nr:hypothetical protein H072_1643 [Dactylellina haptotyla CBS 200.50]